MTTNKKTTATKGAGKGKDAGQGAGKGAGRGKVMSLREQHKLNSRNRLLEAGKELFEANGFLNTSVEMITNAAGASRGTFYLHFGSTAEVLVESFTHAHIDRVLELFDQLAEGETLTQDSLKSWIGRYIDLYEETRLIMRAFIQAQSRGGQDILNLADEVLEAFLSAISGRIANVRRRKGFPSDPEGDLMRALLMWSQLERLCYYWFIRNQKGIERSRVEQMVSQSWMALLKDADLS